MRGGCVDHWLRLIVHSDVAVYGNTVLRASLLHARENGIARSLWLADEAIMQPISTDTLLVGQPNAAAQNGRAYLTFASDNELVNYITNTMPRAGWQHN